MMNRFFHYKDRGGTIGKEITAGLGMFFLSVCGLFINMQLIAKLSISGEYAAATSQQIAVNGEYYALTWFLSMIIAFAGSLLIGLVARLPLVQVSGLGISTVLVSMIGIETGLNYYNLLFVCFISSIIYTALVAVPGVKQFIFRALPQPVRRALPAASGLLMAWIALQLTGIINLTASNITIYGAGTNGLTENENVLLSGGVALSQYSYSTDKYHPLLLIGTIAVIFTVILFLVVRQRTKRPFFISLMGGTVFYLLVSIFRVCFDWKTKKFALDSLWGRLWMVGSEDAMQTHLSAMLKSFSFTRVLTKGSDFSAYTEAGGSVVLLFAVGILTFLLLNMYESEAALQAETRAMVEPMRKALEKDPDFFCGQIIFQKDGYNMAKRTPVAFALGKQLALLKEYGYRVVSVGELMEESPFTDVGRDDPLFEKLVALAKTRAIVFTDNKLRLDDKMTVGELAMLLAPRDEAISRRVAQLRKTGKAGPYDGAMSYCRENGLIDASAKAEDAVTKLPDAMFDKATDFTRRNVYAAYKMEE